MDWRLRSERRRTYDEPGHAHELTFTCFKRYCFLAKERPCQWLAEAIDQARIDFNFSLWAYVFMPDHIHLVIYPHSPYSISAILKAIKGPVGHRAVSYLREHAPNWLSRIEVRHGNKIDYRFWQAGGGYDRNIIDARALFAMVDYIHQNPVRKGLIEVACDWKWSSASWIEGKGKNSLMPDPIPEEWTLVE